MEAKDLGKTSTGMQANVAALLSYGFGWITGLVFYLIEKENKFVRFHAFQSIVVFGALTVLSIVLAFIPIAALKLQAMHIPYGFPTLLLTFAAAIAMKAERQA